MTGNTFPRRGTQDGTKVRFQMLGPAPREFKWSEPPLVAAPRGATLEALLWQDQDGPDCPDLETVRGIWRAIYYVLKDMKTQFEKFGSYDNPVHTCIPQKCVQECLDQFDTHPGQSISQRQSGARGAHFVTVTRSDG